MARIAGFFLVFAVCLLYLAPTIYVGDSALLSTASYYLSSPQPPGYPLYVTLGKLFTLLPFSSVGYRVNLMSAFAAALSFVMMYTLLLYLTRSRPLSFFFSLLPLSLPFVFFESLKAEVYVLNALLAMGVFYLGLRADEEGDPRLLFLVSFLFGLGSGNHHTLALLGVPVLYVTVRYLIKSRNFGAIAYMALFFALGISVYAHIYLRSVALGGEGFIYSPAESLSRLAAIFFRTNYSVSSVSAVASMGSAAGGYLYGFLNMLRYVLINNFGVAVTALSAAMFVALALRHRRRGLYFGLALLPWLVLLPKMTMPGELSSVRMTVATVPYYLPLLFMVSVVLATGLYAIYEVMALRARKAARFAPVFLLLPALYMPNTFLKADVSDNYLAYDKARDTFNLLPVGSWFLSGGDNPSFSSFYMQWVERLREDVLCFYVDVRKMVTQRNSLHYKTRSLHTDGRWQGLESIALSEADTERFHAAAASRRLYISHPSQTPPALRKDGLETFATYLVYGLYPRGMSAGAMTAFIRGSYSKLNYERALDTYTEDDFALEVQNHYGMSLLIAAAYISEDSRRDKLARMSLKLVDPKSFIPFYVSLLVKGGLGAKALEFLDWVKRDFKDTRFADIAHVVEYEMYVHTGDLEAAKAKYPYLQSRGLLIHLGVSKRFFDKRRAVTKP